MSRRRTRSSRHPGRRPGRDEPGPEVIRPPWMRRPGPGPADGRASGAGPERLTEDEVEQLLVLAGRPGLDRQARAVLAGAAAGDVVPVAERRVAALVAGLWSVGWQPAELAWQAGRRRARARTALVEGVRALVATWPDHPVHPAWRDQLADLGVDLPGPSAGPVDVAAGWAGTLDEPVVDALVDLVAVLVRLPPVEVLLPVPGRPDVAVATAAAGAAPAGIDARVLEKVRALLAKAESTSFEAEAQAFTAKAHELMTRHSLEHALVAPGPGDRDRPSARRFCVDDPYADAKSHLLAVIAEASRSTAVLLGGLQMVTVVGFADDLAAVDVLYTSLLVQAQTSLEQLAHRAPPGSQERSRGFRSSFLRGFAHRIGDRLRDAGAATVAEMDRSAGGALVPVLAERRESVDAQVREMHPRLGRKSVAAPSDRRGWYAGAEAADRADLPWGRLDRG